MNLNPLWSAVPFNPFSNASIKQQEQAENLASMSELLDILILDNITFACFPKAQIQVLQEHLISFLQRGRIVMIDVLCKATALLNKISLQWNLGMNKTVKPHALHVVSRSGLTCTKSGWLYKVRQFVVLSIRLHTLEVLTLCQQFKLSDHTPLFKQYGHALE